MSDPRHCRSCGAELAPSLLTCPVCARLVHAEELAALASDAERHEAAGRVDDAVRAWRQALEWLPAQAPQAEVIRRRVDGLTSHLERAPAPAAAMPKWLASLGVAGVVLWKFKFVLALVLTKGKLLLTGLTQSGTLLSMLAAMGVYWTIWGWRFAVGFVVMIYIHEMGHVAALTRLGIKASAPMFIPGLGAVVRMSQYPASPREDARVGLAGPIWGLGAAIASYVIARATGEAIFMALAHAGAVINLFNLMPIWQLDGGRGMRALARPARIGIAALTTVMFLLTREGTLMLVAAASWWKALGDQAPAESDGRALAEFAVLIVALAALTQTDVPGLSAR